MLADYIDPDIRIVAHSNFQIIRHLSDDKYTAHPTINNDTLHLMGWLNVAAEPVIVSVPDHDEGRYWVLHTMDMGHYTTCLFDKRAFGQVFSDAPQRAAGQGTAHLKTNSQI